LSVHNISEFRKVEIYSADPLVPDPSHLQFEISIAKLKMYKFPGSDQILPEIIQAGGETLVSMIHKLISSICNNEELFDQWKDSVVPIRKTGDNTDCNNYRGISLLSTSYSIL
jgi:hypothetical protein